MADEKILFWAPNGLTGFVTPDRKVAVRLDYPQDITGLAPGIVLAMAMPPNEARAFAAMLLRTADKAEAQSARN